MMLGAILNPINTTLIAVALVPIATALGVSQGSTAWLVSALYVSTAVGQPVAGRLVDLFGPRKVYLAGTALLGIGGLVGTTAAGLPMLVVARVLIGIGTCAGYPSALYLLRSEENRLRRGSADRILTWIAVSSQTVAVIGPALGGFLIGMQGWRATFAVNVPMAALAFITGWVLLPRSADHGRRVADLDLLGAAWFAGCLTALLGVVMVPSLRTLPLAAISLAFAVALVRRERRVAVPFLDLGLLRGNRPLTVTYACQGLFGVIVYAQLYGFSQWLQDGRGLSPASSGALLVPMSLSALLVSLLAGTRTTARMKLLGGTAVLALTSAAFVLLADGTPRWLLILVAVGIGVPQGLISLGNQAAMYAQVDPARTASSAGLLRTAMYVGALCASALLGGLFRGGADSGQVHDLGIVLVLVTAVLLALVWWAGGRGRNEAA